MIPKQRLDRIAEFVEILNQKVDKLEDKLINSDESRDLFEDSLHQAARALTHERKEYIASMLKNGLTREEQTHAEKKKLLSILGELNDIEIIFLQFYSLNLGMDRKHPFVEKHMNILRPPSRELSAGPEESNKGAFHDAYNWNLERTGLIEFSRNKMTIQGVRKVTPLGRLFLDYLDLTEN